MSAGRRARARAVVEPLLSVALTPEEQEAIIEAVATFAATEAESAASEEAAKHADCCVDRETLAAAERERDARHYVCEAHVPTEPRDEQVCPCCLAVHERTLREQAEVAAGILSDPDKRHWKQEWGAQFDRAQKAEGERDQARLSVERLRRENECLRVGCAEGCGHAYYRIVLDQLAEARAQLAAAQGALDEVLAMFPSYPEVLVGPLRGERVDELRRWRRGSAPPAPAPGWPGEGA